MVAVRATYNVVAKRWLHGWELHIEGLGVTQSRNLADAEAMARDYVALDLDVAEDSFDVSVTPEVGDGIDELIKRTRDEIADAARAQSSAAESSRALVQKLKLLGLSGKDTALVLGVTPQRVSQLAAAGPKKTGATESWCQRADKGTDFTREPHPGCQEDCRSRKELYGPQEYGEEEPPRRGSPAGSLTLVANDPHSPSSGLPAP
jgi:hypothetical protein